MWDTLTSRHPRVAVAIKHGIFPASFYFLAFCILTFPLMGKFFSHFFADNVDGLQNVWNIWWINVAVRRPDLHPSIWYTDLLHWPYGTTLVGHTLNPFNGFLGVLLLSFFSLETAYNTILIFAFVAAGATMYWLAYYLTRAYWPSLIAGFLYTFSSYHFAHGGNQLQTASLEWIPLFLLAWYALLKRPGALLALGTALALWLVILCDYYYFTYCILAAILVALWYAIRDKSAAFIALRRGLTALGIFTGSALLLTGPLIANLLISNARDPFVGAHDASVYSLDLPALVIPGGSWLFGRWTQSYWSRLPGNIVENSVFLSIPVVLFAGYLWGKRRALEPEVRQQLYLWSLIAGFFFLLALGPALRIGGTVIWNRLMPYSLLGRILPFLSLSGVPARMTVMVTLSACVLTGFALRELFAGTRAKKLIAFALLAIALFEIIPAPMPATSLNVPDYILALRALPNDGGVLDLVKTKPSVELYYQTIHKKPIAFGYLARLPDSVVAQDERLSQAIGAWDYAKLRKVYEIGYIVSNNPLPAPAPGLLVTIQLLYEQKGIRIYRLQSSGE